MDISKKRQTLIDTGIHADTCVAAETRKPARLRGFPSPGLGRRWPIAWPKRPGPFLRERGAFPEPPANPDSGPLHVKLGPPLTIGQVAHLIGCSPWTVRQTLMPRGLPYFRSAVSGRLIFYTDQVIRWIESQQKGGITIK
jgi:hypothetical protein